MRKSSIGLVASMFAAAIATFGPLTAARADCGADRCTDVRVTELNLNVSNDRLLVGTDGQESSLTNCTFVTGGYIALSRSSLLFEQIYSMLLAAQLSGKSVTIRTADTAGGNGSCSVMWANIK